MLFAADGTKYGKNIQTKEKTKISEILTAPEKYEGKTVLVEGTVVNVCEKRGCWIELSSDKEFETIRVKVEDGEIVFPMEAKGKKALVEGQIYSFTVENEANCSGDEKTACSDKEKSEKENKEDGACCSKEETVKKVYQIKGSGAVI
jgi:hypothetical protein